MTRRFSAVLGVGVAALLASMVVGVGVSAQGGGNLAHGTPTPEKVYGDTPKVDKRDYDTQQLLASHTLSDDEQTGRILWVQKCAFCHDGVGQPTYNTMGPWLGAESVQKFGEDTVRTFILNGDVRMPAFRYQLETRQVDELIAFLKTVPNSQKPTPAQLAGRSTPGGSD
jgi:mono/diheme cytochrome c family protein